MRFGFLVIFFTSIVSLIGFHIGQTKKVKNMNRKIEGKIIPFIFSIIILSLFLVSMWNYSVVYSYDRMSQIDVFLDAKEWLSLNLGEDKKAILPIVDVFLASNPALEPYSKSYKSFWDDAEVDFILSTEEEKNSVRQLFWNYVFTDSNKVRFVIAAWNDNYMKSILDINPINLRDLEICEEINLNLKEVKRFNLKIPSTGWKSFLVICEVK